MLVISLLGVGIQMPASAAMINSEQLISQAEIETKRSQINTLLARDNVKNALLDYGVNSDNLEQRINNLSDAEIMTLHDQLDQLPAGQGVLGTILIVLVILMLLDIAGVTDIFPAI